MLVLHKSIPAASFAELVAYAKRNPGALNYVSQGVGTSAHLSVTLSVGQAYDHHSLGYANQAVSNNCGNGETEAALASSAATSLPAPESP